MSTPSKSSNSNPFILSQRFTSYIEKHRIFQLLQELSSMLLIKRPDDHVLFLKQSLHHAARRLDVPRIIIIAPPNYDKLQLACKLQKKLDIPLITLNEIHDDPKSIILSATNNAIDNLRSILIGYMKMKCDGWLFLDFPRNEKEARFLLRSGILPTHVIEITTADLPLPCEVSLINNYYRELRGLRHVFSNFLMKIDVDNCSLEDVFQRCLKLIKCRKYSRPPSVMRILIIDGNDFVRCRDLGRHIAETFNVVCIHFSDIAEQVSLQDSVIGNKTREILDGDQPILPPQLKIEIFEDFLSRSTAVKQGWVLTDFPCSVEDFKHLDMTDSPPNRVIIIVNDDQLVEEETIENSIEEDGLKQISLSRILGCRKEQEEGEHVDVEGIIKYAGKTALIIKESDDLKIMKERIDYNLMQPPANAPPRVPRSPSEINFRNIEYDPDDKPSTDKLSKIRKPEPELTLI